MSVTYRHPVTGEEITFSAPNRILERTWERVEDKPRYTPPAPKPVDDEDDDE